MDVDSVHCGEAQRCGRPRTAPVEGAGGGLMASVGQTVKPRRGLGNPV